MTIYYLYNMQMLYGILINNMLKVYSDIYSYTYKNIMSIKLQYKNNININ